MPRVFVVSGLERSQGRSDIIEHGNELDGAAGPQNFFHHRLSVKRHHLAASPIHSLGVVWCDST